MQKMMFASTNKYILYQLDSCSESLNNSDQWKLKDTGARVSDALEYIDEWKTNSKFKNSYYFSRCRGPHQWAFNWVDEEINACHGLMKKEKIWNKAKANYKCCQYFDEIYQPQHAKFYNDIGYRTYTDTLQIKWGYTSKIARSGYIWLAKSL